MRIRGAVAVVTGASSGIGRATALALAREGATVVGAARRLPLLQDLATEIERSGGKALAVRCDVRSFEDVEALASRVDEELGRCDILVNNAGLGAGRAFADLDRERIDQVIQTNMLGVMYCTKAFLPMMLGEARGHIVNVASLAGRHPVPGAAVYSASKHAVAAFSESIYHELKPRGILVTAVNPGFVETPGFPQSDLPRAIVMRPGRVARAIVDTVRRGRAPQVSVPRWAGAFEFFRVALPGPYRYAAGRVIGARGRGSAQEPPSG